MLLDGSFIESTYVIEWLYFRIIGVMEGTFNKFDKFSTFKEKFRAEVNVSNYVSSHHWPLPGLLIYYLKS